MTDEDPTYDHTQWESPGELMIDLLQNTMTAEHIELLDRQLNELEYCTRQKAETRNLPNSVREAIFEAVDNLVAAQRLLSEVRPRT